MGERALQHYESLRIDPHTKRPVFADALDTPKALALYRHFADRVQRGFGLVECNDQPVAKLSDSPGKTLSTDATFLAYLRQVCGRAA